MKRFIALLLAVICVLGMTACSKEPEPTEPYVPPVQGGYFQETEPPTEPPVATEPVVEETEPAIEETAPEETEPVETEPIEETEPTLTRAEEMKALFEGNEIYFRYNLLTEAQKDLYILACETIEEGHKTILLGDIKATEADIKQCLLSVWYDHPEYFWYSPQTYTISTMNNEPFSIDISYYPELMNKLEANKITFNRIVDALVAKAQEKNSILDQERMIHDYICKSTVYEEGPLDQSAWSCLVERKTVCAGYTKAFQVVMNRLNIPCYMVVGDFVQPDKTERHGWNVIKLVDGYYAVDLTSNDCDEKNAILYHKYNFAYSTYEGEYVIDEDCQVFPDCTETRYSFKNTYGIDENVASAMSFTDTSTVISSMEEFKYFHEQSCRHNGFGEWEVKYVVVGESLLNQIMDYINEMSYMETYISDIAKFNNISSCTLAESLSRVEFDNVYGIVHTVKLAES